MDIFALVAEDKIRTAIKNGEFDHLPGMGQPLQLEDLSSVPEDLRMAYKVLKNAGFINDEKSLDKEIRTLQDLIRCCTDPEEKQRLERKLNEKRLRFQRLVEDKHWEKSKAFRRYEAKINDKFGPSDR
jgi:hypothetical protein